MGSKPKIDIDHANGIVKIFVHSFRHHVTGEIVYPKTADAFCFEVTLAEHNAYLERKAQKQNSKKPKENNDDP